MKLTYFACAMIVMVLGSSSAKAQMCLVKKPMFPPSAADTRKIMDCMAKPQNCKGADVKALCDWAVLEAKTRRPLEKDDSTFSKVADTCLAVGQYRCIDEADRAVGNYAYWQNLFLEGKTDKPLAVVQRQISLANTNLLVVANMEALDASAKRFTDFYVERSRVLRAIPKTFMKPEELSNYLAKVREEYKKIRDFHKGVLKEREVFAVLIRRLNNNLAAFQKTVTNMVSNQFCAEVKPKLEPLIADSDRWRELNEKSAREYVLYTETEEADLIRFVPGFSNEAIEIYAQNKSITLQLAKKEVEDILAFDDLLFDLNQWWINSTVNGFADDEHNLYLQYAAPLLAMESMKTTLGQSLTKLTEFKNKGIKSADGQITKTEKRLAEVQRNIDWLTTRGWKGQWQRQVELTREYDTADAKAPCKKLVNGLLQSSKTAPVDQSDFEKRFEGQFRTLSRQCGGES